MFLGLAWYWWLVIAAALIVSIPFKLRFLQWWAGRMREQQKQNGRGKWGDGE